MERPTSITRIFEGRVLKLRVDNVTLTDGQPATREVVEHRGAAAIIPLLPDNRVVLVRQYRYPIQLELLEIPAGTLEEGESPNDCAIRELTEETGYNCEELTKISECYVAPGYSTEKIHFYLARKLTRSVANPDEDERIKVQIITLPDVLRKIRKGEICDAKTICAIFRLLDYVKPDQY
jgi:ADP-ribose pyrophosphatase